MRLTKEERKRKEEREIISLKKRSWEGLHAGIDAALIASELSPTLSSALLHSAHPSLSTSPFGVSELCSWQEIE